MHEIRGWMLAQCFSIGCLAFMKPSYLVVTATLMVGLAGLRADSQLKKNVPEGIKLHQNWDKAMREDTTVMEELRDLVSPFVSPSENVAAPAGAPIYKGVTYLMPLREAIRTLGTTQPVNSKRLINTPGFPSRSVYVYTFNGNFSGFETLYILTDVIDQVVAVELLTSRRGKTDLQLTTSSYSFRRKENTRASWRVYDFVNCTTKIVSGEDVFHESTDKSGPIEIESLFKLSGTRLYLAKPFAELILYRISKCGSLPQK